MILTARVRPRQSVHVLARASCDDKSEQTVRLSCHHRFLSTLSQVALIYIHYLNILNHVCLGVVLPKPWL